MTRNQTIATRIAVLLLATDQHAADRLLDILDDLRGAEAVLAIGVNTRSGEVEIKHVDNLPDAVSMKIGKAVDAGAEAEIPVRTMMWTPERVIDELSDWIGRDVQDGWYEGEEWRSAARDYEQALYYLGRDTSLVEKWIEDYETL